LLAEKVEAGMLEHTLHWTTGKCNSIGFSCARVGLEVDA
jgi:hypothetical protein